MTKFQVLGIAFLLFILISYLRKFQRPALDKLFIGLLLATGIFFVLYPEGTNQMAHFLGIGRGADLIFYVAILGFGYVIMLLYSKIKKLEEQLAKIIRQQSLESVKLPDLHA
jgi:small membrane protein